MCQLQEAIHMVLLWPRTILLSPNTSTVRMLMVFSNTKCWSISVRPDPWVCSVPYICSVLSPNLPSLPFGALSSPYPSLWFANLRSLSLFPTFLVSLFPSHSHLISIPQPPFFFPLSFIPRSPSLLVLFSLFVLSPSLLPPPSLSNLFPKSQFLQVLNLSVRLMDRTTLPLQSAHDCKIRFTKREISNTRFVVFEHYWMKV